MKKPSFFNCVHSPYYIFSPQYSAKSAGGRALHHLCHALNEMGQEAYIIGCETECLTLRTPLLSVNDVLRHQQTTMAPIMVYPEVVSGNPLNMPFVVRWLLNQAGHLGGGDFAEEDMIFSFSASYIDEHSSAQLLNIPVINNAVFNNENNAFDEYRQGACFYAHKYLAKGYKLTEHAEQATSLCQDIALTPQDIADILRRSEVLYCYEPSAIIGEAVLCGCPVIIIDSPFLTENLSEKIVGKGLAYSSDNNALVVAKSTIKEVTYNNQLAIEYCWWQVDQFVRNTQAEISVRRGDDNQDWVESVLNLIATTSNVTLPKLSLRGLNNKRWLEKNALLEGRAVIMAERMVNTWQHQPSFHLIMVINQHELGLLSDTLMSLQEQLYTAWGLTIISNMPQPEFFTDLPQNIEWLQITESLNAAINHAVSDNSLDWIMQVLPGDKLTSHSLLSFADAINQNSQSKLIYSDEADGEHGNNLLFKPDFNLELLCSSSYLGRSVIVQRQAFQTIGGYTGLAYVYNTDLAFNVSERWGDNAISHIADILYIATPCDIDDKVLSDSELSVRVAYFQRREVPAKLSLLEQKNTFRIQYIEATQPLVSIVIANKNNASAIWRCVNELLTHTDYPNFELIIVDQQSDVEDVEFIYQEIKDDLGGRLNLLSYGEANYSAMINFGVSHAKGDYIVVLANSAMPVNSNWLMTMSALAQRTDVGVVGVRVINADNKIVHAGGVLGATDDVHGLFYQSSFGDAGYMGRAQLTQQYSFVSNACFIVSTEDYKAIGGLDDGDLANTKYCVADLCLKLKQQGLKTIWEPQAVFKQNMDLANGSNGVVQYKTDIEAAVISRWPAAYQNDDSYNRHLSLRTSDFEVETAINLGWQRQHNNRPRIMAFPFNNTAIGHFRVIEPLRELTHAAMIESTLLPGHDAKHDVFIPNRFEINRASPDVLLMHLTLNDEFYDFIKWIKAETSIVIIFSIDDLVTSLANSNASKNKIHKDMRHRLRRTLALCDRVIASTQPIADALSIYSHDIVVVPNSIDLARWSMIKPQINTNKRLRIGWAGGEYHAGDLEIISELVKSTAIEVDWIFMGLCPKALRPYIHEYHEFSSFADYPEKLASLKLDLAVAPLEINAFNEAKSNLRLLEYGMLAWPVICTDIYPYQINNPPVIRVGNTPDEWLAALRTAIAEPEKLQEKGQALHRWVLNNYALDMHQAQWFNALKIK
jgi:O-antigen biosynthesis protein